MPTTGILPSAIALGVLLCAAPASAQCTMKADCKGDRSCDSGRCVYPTPALPPSAPAPALKPPVVAMPTTPRLVPRSEALGGVGVFTVVTGGMVLLSSFGMVFSSGACGLHRRKVCPDRSLHVLVGFMSGAVLTGLGVTLIKSGYRKVPAWTNPTARLSPWVGPKQGGLALQLDL